GVNDIGKDGKGIDRAAAALEKVVKAVKEKKTPELTLITCTPGAKKHKELNPSIAKWNEKVKAIAKDNAVGLIDLHALVADAEGALPEELTSDGLHWKDGVYEKLGAEIEKTLAKPADKKKR
ncbi:MAG: GDSL-type esterase/lipase family protein, partial [Planctomycetota bacterium]